MNGSTMCVWHHLGYRFIKTRLATHASILRFMRLQFQPCFQFMPCGWIIVQFKNSYTCCLEIQSLTLIALPFCNIVAQSHNVININVSHVVNPSTLEDEFITLVQHIEYKLFKRNNKKLETQWWRDHKKGLYIMHRTKWMTLMELLLQKLNKRINGVDTHFLTSFFCPPFPWTHNNNQ